MGSTIIWDLKAWNSVEIHRHSGATAPVLNVKRVNQTRKEQVASSRTSVNFYKTTRHHIQEDSALHSHRQESLRSKKISCISSSKAVSVRFSIIRNFLHSLNSTAEEYFCFVLRRHWVQASSRGEEKDIFHDFPQSPQCKYRESASNKGETTYCAVQTRC
jgi:hypothetical protein